MKKKSNKQVMETMHRTTDAMFNQMMKPGRTNAKPAVNTGSPFKKKK